MFILLLCECLVMRKDYDNLELLMLKWLNLVSAESVGRMFSESRSQVFLLVETRLKSQSPIWPPRTVYGNMFRFSFMLVAACHIDSQCQSLSDTVSRCSNSNYNCFQSQEDAISWNSESFPTQLMLFRLYATFSQPTFPLQFDHL